MPSSTASYWEGRYRELLDQAAGSEAELVSRLTSLYESERARLKRDIAAFYAEHGEDNVIEYRKLLQSLDAPDRELLMRRMDEFARKFPQYAHLMPVRESIYRLDRLEGLQASILMQQLEIGAVEVEEVQAHLEDQARLGANFAAEQMGFGSAFYGVGSGVAETVAGAAWAKGERFSDRIWANREKLAGYINDDLARGLVSGVKYDELARELSERFDVLPKQAKRLVFTEGTFVLNESQAREFERFFDAYEVSTIGERACESCRSVEDASLREPFRYSERKPGENYPPFHPWCRCMAAPVVPDDFIERYIERNGG